MRMVKVFHATLPVSVRAPARVTGVHVPNRPDTYRTFLQADFHRGVRLYPPFAPLSIRVKSPTFSGGIGGRPTRHARPLRAEAAVRSEEHTSELQSLAYLVCRLLLEKKKNTPMSTSA